MLSKKTKEQLIARIVSANSVRGAARLAYRALQSGVPQSDVQPIARAKRIGLKEINRARQSEDLPRPYDPHNGTGNPI